MTDFNMYNKVPFNVVVPEFQPERQAPIYPFITRKYPCQEDVLLPTGKNNFGRLSWKIQQPDQTMVWSSVKLVLPLAIQAKDEANNDIDMRVASQQPACNVAVASTPMNAFRQTSLSLNGKIFSEENVFRRTLDTCYQGVGAQAYGDNHSLKPIVTRNFHNPARVATFHVVDSAGTVIPNEFVSLVDVETDILDSAFSLLEHNSPFLERARLWQDNLDYDGKTWRGDISQYLELGPFQARARKGNTAVPYIRDFHLMLNFDTNPSKFDTQRRVLPALETTNLRTARSVAVKLLEFATLPNVTHHGETVSRVNSKFARYFDFQWSAKPYLEVTYTKYLQSMQPFYNLRCFEHQLEKSNNFVLDPLATFDTQKVTARVTSRLLSYPTKIYLFADAAAGMKDSFISGGVRRSCLLENIHCRINQRPDAVFNPSQEDCFEMFQRNTNSSLEYGAWRKSPIYCFTPVDLGQSDMFANDARQVWVEWDASVGLTPLQIQENVDTLSHAALSCSGYAAGTLAPYDWKGFSGMGNFEYEGFWRDYTPYKDNSMRCYFEFYEKRSGDVFTHGLFPHNADLTSWMKHQKIAFQDLALTGQAIEQCPNKETIEVKQIDRSSWNLDGFIWLRINCLSGDPDYGKAGGYPFFVPKGHNFWPDAQLQHEQYVNPMSVLIETPIVDAQGAPVTDGNGAPTYKYTVDPADMSNLNFPRMKDATSSDWFNPPLGQTVTYKAVPNGMCPGAHAYVVDGHGIRNKDDGAFEHGGLIDEGTAPFLVLDQKAGNKMMWVAFQLSEAQQHQSSGFPNAWVRYRLDDATLDQVKDEPARTIPGHTGSICTVVAGTMNRHVTGTAPQGRVDMKINLKQYAFNSYPIKNYNEADPTVTDKEYNLKALYEYGNAQYQFASDAAPTRVLPNLVPVGSKPGIPDL